MHTANAGSRGRGLFASPRILHAARSYRSARLTLLSLSAQAARLTCALLRRSYCSEFPRLETDRRVQSRRGLRSAAARPTRAAATLLRTDDAPPGSPAAELAELLAVPSESSLFLPLGGAHGRWRGGRGLGERERRPSARGSPGGRRASLTTGGPWVEAGGVEPNPGHFPEEQDDESGDDDEDVDDDESDGWQRASGGRL